jgi:tetraacyldisaccharide 4'-kinase
MKFNKPKFWDQKKPNIFVFLLWPLSIVYKIIINLKNKKKNKFNSIKTICLGNIYIGGTGKTSLSIKIKKILDKKNIKSCFIKKLHSDQIDEIKLLDMHGKTFVAKKRLDSLKIAISKNFDVAIFDDGLQDSSIEYDLTFVCFNNLNWIGNGFLIPAGPLRENINNLKFHKNVFLNGNDEDLEDIKTFIKNINPKIVVHESNYWPSNIEDFNKDKKYLAFSGIGNHKTFINMLRKENLNILIDLEFPDHYNYKENDINKIFLKANNLNAQIITTEKDYLRINHSKLKDIKFIKAELKIKEEDKLIKILMEKHVEN